MILLILLPWFAYRHPLGGRVVRMLDSQL